MLSTSYRRAAYITIICRYLRHTVSYLWEKLLLYFRLTLACISAVKDLLIPKVFFFHGSTAPTGSRAPHFEISRSYSDAPRSVGLLWTSDRPDSEISTGQHTTPKRDRHPCCGGGGSNPQSQKGPRLRPCGHWNGQFCGYTQINECTVRISSPN